MTADNEGGYACVVAGDKWKISASNFLLILLNLPCSAVRKKERERKKDRKRDTQTSGGKKGEIRCIIICKKKINLKNINFSLQSAFQNSRWIVFV